MFKNAVGTPEIYVIEGIGSPLGLFNYWDASCYTDYSNSLLCHYEDGILVYPPNPASCFIVAVPDISEDPEIKMYPNPVDDFLVIDCKKDKFRWTNASCYNAAGQLQFQFSLNEVRTIQDFSSLPSGVYFLKICTGRGVVFSRKLIKH